jgi:hypothetical protein
MNFKITFGPKEMERMSKSVKMISSAGLSSVLIFLMMFSCVEKISFDIPSAASQIVVEGMISDMPGPYIVKISRAMEVDADSAQAIPVENASITLYDDQGSSENLSETSPGEYATSGTMQGQVGHSYHIKIQTDDGKVFESQPDRLNPVGAIDTIRYEFEARTKEERFGPVNADVFKIYMDAHAGEGSDSYVRWKFQGTYQVFSNPELHQIWSEGFLLKLPYPCSGYIVAPSGPFGGGTLQKVAECTCCTCWANHYEAEPLIYDGQFVSENQYKNVKIAEVPISVATFYNKYRVNIEQMSLSRNAFDFFRLVRAQKESSSSLFQPPSGQLIGNIIATNSNDPVVGLFWATAIKSKTIYIPRSKVPYLLPPIFFVTDPCTYYYPNSTATKPEFWK